MQPGPRCSRSAFDDNDNSLFRVEIVRLFNCGDDKQQCPTQREHDIFCPARFVKEGHWFGHRHTRILALLFCARQDTKRFFKTRRQTP